MHLLSVFDDDSRSLRAIGRWLARALLDGGLGVVVAAADHRSVIVDTIYSEGADVVGDRADGRLVELDAGETLARVFTGDAARAAAFDAEIGDVVRAAVARGGPVRVYGEMVALLWEEGRIGAVLDLETRWNDLAAQAPFSLVCGYPAAVLSSGPIMDELRRIHAPPVEALSELLGGAVDVRVARLPCSPQAPAQARRFVVETLAEWRKDSQSEDAAVVVSELASNAVLHAGSDLAVAVGRLTDGVRIAVADDSDLAPVVRPPTSPAGRGLHIVAALATDWGTEPLPDGKAVWAELRA